MPNSPLATGAQTRLSLVKEAAFNTIPASPKFQIVRPSDLTLSLVPKFTQSKEIRADGMPAANVLVDQDVTAHYGSELSLDSHDDVIEAAMRTTRVATPEIVKATTEIGAVATGGVFNTGAGLGTPFKVGHLIKTTGFAQAANNVISRVTTAASGAITAVGAATVAEATPPVGARIKVIGIRGAAAGSITATAAPNTLTVATVDPGSLGIVAGMWVKCSGFTGTVANNDWVRVASVAGAGPWTLTLDIVPTGWAADAAAGQVISLYFTDYFRPGNTRNSFAAEEAHLDVALFKYLSGLVLNQLQIQLRPSSIVSMAADFIGCSGGWQAQVATPAYLSAKTTTPLNTSKNLGKTFINGSWISGVVTSADITIKANANPQKALGTFGNADVTYGSFGVDVALEKFFLDTALNALMMAGTPVNIVLIAYDALTGSGYLVDLRAVVLMDGQTAVADSTTPLKEPYKGSCQMDPNVSWLMHIAKLESWS